MAAERARKWIYSKQILEDTPSRKAGVDADKELSYRQQAANLIQDMGQRLVVNQLTINTAIVYMHRFYVYHSFTIFSRYVIAPTALFLAAKVEEQPKKLQHVLQICHACLHPDKPNLDPHSEAYMKQAQELVQHELLLLQTLGFEISVDHPHTHVVKCTQLVKASRDLSQMAYFMATNSLHLTTFCLLYKPTVVAAMCIHLSCKWSKYEIPLSSDGKHYWSYMDPSITEPLLDTIVTEFLKILTRCPTRLRKLRNYRPSLNASKDGQDSKEEVSSGGQTNTKTAPFQAPNPPIPSLPPVKEKKQTLSIEEYKKAQAAKSIANVSSSSASSHKSVLSLSSQVSTGQVNKLDGNSQNLMSPQNHILPKSVPTPSHQKIAPGNYMSKTVKSDSVSHQGVPNHKNMMRPHLQQEKLPDQTRNLHHSKSQPNLFTQSKPANNTEVHVEQAMTKDIEGRIQNDKLLKQLQGDNRRYPSAQHPSSGSARQGERPAYVKDLTDHSKKHPSSDKVRDSDSQSRKSVKNLDSNQIAELYHKYPEKLLQYLKSKAQTVRLTTEEKNLYSKLRAKEEERRKRKAAASIENVGAKPKQEKVSNDTSSVQSPGGSLKFRIKIGSKSDLSKSSVVKIVGSDSESHSSPRKRPHSEHVSHPSSSKHAKKSERHKHHHHEHSSGGSNESKSRLSTHRRHSGSSKPGIDEALFQKSLSDAMKMTKVQQQPQTSIPTVTLKRAANGKASNYIASISSSKHGFDPLAPVPAEVPDDIFEEDHGDTVNVVNRPTGSLISAEDSSACGSTPESGEIKESPVHGGISVHNHSENKKAPSLFSPDSKADSQLMRSSSGYHSGGSQDTDFPSFFSVKTVR